MSIGIAILLDLGEAGDEERPVRVQTPARRGSFGIPPSALGETKNPE